MKYIDTFKERLLKENNERLDPFKIIVDKYSDLSLHIKWIDETKNPNEVGVFDFDLNDNKKEAKIVGYRKDNKLINGYEFIKKSIDYVLNLGYIIVSSGNRSDSAIKVWNKLKDEYNITEEKHKLIPDPRFDEDYTSRKHNIKKILSKKN